ncbi:MAG: ribosome silencing factor [Phycisphaerales bacterium]|nr:ribosome silencing factor [Phycisphaerales bacterium]MCB9854253.1 ribosome silencing factor [Phycisphaerales bacterium]MCB9864739.1 ribosome silencing factor [Phycisphaerales bacterium]
MPTSVVGTATVTNLTTTGMQMSGNKDLLKHAESLGVAPQPDAQLPERKRPQMNSEVARVFAIDCAKLLRDDKCEDIVLLDLRGVSPICDFFVIATGTSDRQMRAVADHVKMMGKDRGEAPYSVSGYDESTWIVMDYVDVIIHLFDPEQRTYYDLDSLWGDSPHVSWQ